MEERLDRAVTALETGMMRKLEKSVSRLSELERTLRAVSPESVLDRGYAAIKRGKKYLIRAEMLESGYDIDIVMADGMRRARISGEDANGS